MKNIFKIFCTLGLVAGLASCEDYLDVNQDPNNPQVGQLTPEDVLSASQTSPAATFGVTMNQLGNVMMANWSANGSDFADPFGDEFRYDITSDFYSGVWNNLYVRTANYTFIENYNDGRNWSNHKAVAKILKAFYFQYIVDLYGDSPYSEIHEGTNALFPSYDDDATTYRSLITLLDDAINLIDNAGGNVEAFNGTDVMLNGDMTMWKKFANTIKLRLLVRQFELADQDATVKTYIDGVFADMQTQGAQFLTTGENIMVNPGYLNTTGKQNPFFASFGYDPLGNTTTGYRLVGPSAYSADFLDGTSTGVVDQRAFRFWKRRVLSLQPCDDSPGAITGIAQGSNGRPSTLGNALICQPTADLPLMTAAESLLLQAEAAQRGYAVSGSALSHFNNAVISSFTYLGLTSTDANTYLANVAGNPELHITAGGLQAIARQKWIALTSINGIELWIEYTRTGMPAGIPLPAPATTPTGDRPVRLMYPSSEYSGNSNNVVPQTTDDAFTSKVFWDVN